MMHKICHTIFFLCFPLAAAWAQQELQTSNLSDSTVSLSPNWVLPTALPDNGTINGNHAEKNIRFRSSTKKGKLHGEWSSWYEDGLYHDQGLFKNGLPDGEWKVWYSNGRLQYVRHFSADQYIKVQQEWLRPHPKMVLTPLGELHRKDRNAARTQLTWNAIFQPQTDTEYYYPVFRTGLLHGTYINYYENGALKDSGLYRNGLREGIWITAADNPETYTSGLYRNGKKEGVWKRIRKNKTEALLHYKNDRVVFQKTY